MPKLSDACEGPLMKCLSFFVFLVVVFDLRLDWIGIFVPDGDELCFIEICVMSLS